jgi:thioredoxin reductase (NADPH)
MRLKWPLIIYLCLFCHFSFAEQVVILGSGPAGLTAAIYTSRAGLSTLVIDGDGVGGQIALSNMVENFPGFPQGIDGFMLGENMQAQAERFGARMQRGKVVEANLTQRPFMLKMEDGQEISAETLIIASGASTRWLGLESEKALIGKGVACCATCDGFLFKKKEVIVVGGGDAALEDALFLANYASKVTIVHRKDSLNASKYLQSKAFAHPKIHFIWDCIVENIADAHQEQVAGVCLKNLLTQERQFYPCQGAFIAIGHIPNTSLFQDQLELSANGYIKTQPSTTHTSIPGVFAAGDVADARYRQAITAAGTGCMAGMDAYYFIQQLEKP